MKTAQEVFDGAVIPLLEQGEQSYDYEIDRCMYRGPNGLKCAVGFLIPDELYKPSFDTDDVYVGGVAEAIGMSEHLTLLKQLQEVHDSHEPHEWRALFTDLAKAFNLVMPA